MSDTVFYLVCSCSAVVVAGVAWYKGRSPIVWALAGFVFTVFAFGAVLGLRNKRRPPGRPSRTALSVGHLLASIQTHRPKPKPQPELFVPLVRRYREIGFLAGRAESDEKLAKLVEPTDPGTPHDHLDVLGLDRDRIWWEDIEADMFPDVRPYATSLEHWAAISCGALRPEEIVETWADEEEGPVTLSFMHDGVRVELHPKWNDDWLDLDVLHDLNRMIAPTGRRFVQGATYGQDAFVLCATEAERERLAELGFSFAQWWPDDD